MMLSREEIALRILCTMMQTGAADVSQMVSENDVRASFKIAQSFERISDEMGGRPVRTRGRPINLCGADDDDE
jgi:hypothetical protein